MHVHSESTASPRPLSRPGVPSATADPFPEEIAVFDDDARLLEGAPRLFGIVAQPDDDDNPEVVAWGHELPDHAVVTWRLRNGGAEVAVFGSAEEALATARMLYPARLLYAAPAVQGV
jgi:hypothetical protein